MPTLSSPTVAEGNSSTTNMTFVFTRDAQTATQNYVYDILPASTATNGQDYSGPTGSFTLAANAGLTQNIIFQIFGDTAYENGGVDETIVVRVREVLGPNSFGPDVVGTGSIQDTDAPPVLNIDSVTLAEGSGGGSTNFTFTVTRTGDLSGASSTAYTVAIPGGSTLTAEDFAGGTIPAGGTVSFAAGETTKTVTVPILADTIVETGGTETFRVTLGGPTTGATLGTSVGTGTVTDDDFTLAIAAPNPVPIDEGTSTTAGAATNYDFVVTRTGSQAGAVSFTYTVTAGTTNPTSAADFVGATTGTITLSGATSTVVRIGVAQDFDVEQNETFNVTISNLSSGSIATGGATATVTITDNDTPGTVNIVPGNVQVTEGDSGSVDAVVTLERTGGTGAPFAVTLSTANNSATAGADYTAVSQVVNFAANQTSATVSIPVLGDLLIEGGESFNLILSAPTNGAVLGTNGTVSILDNDVVGTITVGSADFTEGNASGTANVVVSRSGGGAAFTVQYATGDSSAVAGSDYTATSGTLTFAAGQNTATIAIGIVGDTVVEPDETFNVNLSNLTNGGTLLTSTGTVRIVNDDGLPPPPGGPVQSGNTVFVSQSYVQPANDSTTTTISTQNNAGTEPINITGNANTQTIIGNYGVNVLTGGGGNDTLIGLLGNDSYVVTASGAVVAENAGEGTDTVSTTVDFVLSANASVELLQIADATTTGAINLIGSTASQQITGNAGDNIINGFGGSDTMTGMGGSDTYLVRGPGDVVIETNGGGNDTVFTTVSYNLGANEVERLSTVVQADTVAIDLIGNFATQAVIGNFGNNVLNGGSGGIDTLIGLRGDDVYAVGDSRTDVFENAGEGNDTVVTSVDYALDPGVSVEVLAVQNRPGTATINLFGNELAQTIAGNEGVNYIDGGNGNDVLIGGGGVDTFAFTTALGANNVDVVADFQVGTDRIGLLNSIFSLGAGGPTAAIFVNSTAAGDADDRLIYNAANGQLFYDADGNGAGAQVLFAIFAAGTPLSAASFDVLIPAPTTP